jgi:hypothetical protein
MCFDVEKWMHKEKNLGMSYGRFFWLGTQNESIFWDFFWDVIFQEYFKCQPTWCLL